MRFRVCRRLWFEVLTTGWRTPFNAKVTTNQHRWKNSFREQSVAILEQLAAELRSTWAVDSETPKLYPFVTHDLFSGAKLRLVDEAKLRLVDKAPAKRKMGKLPPAGPRPKHFAALFGEKTIKAVYEDKYSDSYDEAIKLAGSGERGFGKAFHKLLKAAETAYLIGMGCEIPAPRIHFLHRELLDIADLLDLDDLTNKGLEEFFEDLCPCRKKHNAEAIRKLRKRKARFPRGRLQS
jgi:hypothetical protein